MAQGAARASSIHCCGERPAGGVLSADARLDRVRLPRGARQDGRHTKRADRVMANSSKTMSEREGAGDNQVAIP
jgi:hypothetical protein